MCFRVHQAGSLGLLLSSITPGSSLKCMANVGLGITVDSFIESVWGLEF